MSYIHGCNRVITFNIICKASKTVILTETSEISVQFGPTLCCFKGIREIDMAEEAMSRAVIGPMWSTRSSLVIHSYFSILQCSNSNSNSNSNSSRSRNRNTRKTKESESKSQQSRKSMPPGRSGISVMSTLRSGNRIEPGTSRTLSENYTPKPTSQKKCHVTDVRTHTAGRTVPRTDRRTDRDRHTYDEEQTTHR
jgi:hypothetical protein